MDINLASYKPLFLTSARENLLGMKEAVATLIATPQDSQALEELFIKSHSLKGQSMTMGYTGVAKVNLAIEHYTRSIRDGKSHLDPSVLPHIARACEQLSSALLLIEQQDKEPLLAEIITNLEKRLGVKV
jgi:two-component system chemotaxis sensor kinase CheA